MFETIWFLTLFSFKSFSIREMHENTTAQREPEHVLTSSITPFNLKEKRAQEREQESEYSYLYSIWTLFSDYLFLVHPAVCVHRERGEGDGEREAGREGGGWLCYCYSFHLIEL